MEDNKKKINPFLKLIMIFFLIFIAFYIALESGYYPSRIEKKTIMTNQEINDFENNIKENKVVSTSGYIKKDENYSNFVTKTGNSLTYSLGKIVTESIKGCSDILKALFW